MKYKLEKQWRQEGFEQWIVTKALFTSLEEGLRMFDDWEARLQEGEDLTLKHVDGTIVKAIYL